MLKLYYANQITRDFWTSSTDIDSLKNKVMFVMRILVATSKLNKVWFAFLNMGPALLAFSFEKSIRETPTFLRR